jgi:c-di-GMP phosphodiesterase
MNRVLLSRQPIYRADMSIFAYELLFRDSESDRATFRDEDEATAQVIVNTFMEIGLVDLVGSNLACINVSRRFILSDFCESLPPDRVILELVEPLEMDAPLSKRLEQLASSGYQIAVGDFAFSEKFRSLLDMASLAKFDVLTNDWKRLERSIAQIDRSRTKVAAERVETSEQFHTCKTAGFDYFQGYFFCRPEFVRSERMPLNRVTTLRLIGKLHDPDVTIDQLEDAIRQNLSLSYKLLRYVGSAGCAVRGQIQSIRHAAVLAGIDRLKIWAGLILFSGIEENAREVTITAIVRARMCEKLGEAMRMEKSADRCFLVGLFSVLEALLNLPLKQILETLHLDQEINDALLHRKGNLGKILECVLAYERRDWNDVRCGDLDQDTIRGIYVKSMAWSIRTLNTFSEANADEAVRA